MTPELEALERLKPCPFCGCADVLYSPPCNDVEPDDFVLSGWQACCRGVGCGVMGPTCETADEVAKHWNTRAVSKPLPWLRAEEVTEPGWYWNHTIGRPRPFYVSHEEVGDVKAIGIETRLPWGDSWFTPITNIDGTWQRIPEPELPED